MDVKSEIESLAGQNLALESILFWLLFHIQRKHDEPIRRALDDAANMVEARAIAAGKSVSPHHLTRALGIIEHFQKSILSGK